MALAAYLRALQAQLEGTDSDPLALFTPLLHASAVIATGDDAHWPAVEVALANLKTKGWQLSAPAQRIWAGERDADTLTTDLDDQDTALIRRVLVILAAPLDGEPPQA